MRLNESSVDALLKSIKDFCVLYFKDAQHEKSAPLHHYLTFPIGDDLGFIICIVTSQIKRREDFCRIANPKMLDSLVPIDQNTFDFLKGPSLIDCNQAEHLTKNELRKRINFSFPCTKRPHAVPEQLKQEIIGAIIRSPRISAYIQEFAKGKLAE